MMMMMVMIALNRQSPNHSSPLERCNRRNRPSKRLAASQCFARGQAFTNCRKLRTSRCGSKVLIGACNLHIWLLWIAIFKPQWILVVIPPGERTCWCKIHCMCRSVDGLRTGSEGFHIASLVSDYSICINFNVVVLSLDFLQVIVGISLFNLSRLQKHS